MKNGATRHWLLPLRDFVHRHRVLPGITPDGSAELAERLIRNVLSLGHLPRPVLLKHISRICPRNDDLLAGQPGVSPLRSLFALNRRRAWERSVSLR